jgi:sporulation protein YlmC with PRC-barrel domain
MKMLKPMKVMLAGVPLLIGLLLLPSYGAGAAVEGEQGNLAPPDMTGGKVPPKEHKLVPPIPEGNLKLAESHEMLNKDVKNKKGDTIGKIEKIIVDSETGKVAYAEVSLVETKQMVPIPWSLFKFGNDGEVIMNATKDQLEEAGSNFPAINPSDFEHKGGEPLKPNLRQGGG